MDQRYLRPALIQNRCLLSTSSSSSSLLKTSEDNASKLSAATRKALQLLRPRPSVQRVNRHPKSRPATSVNRLALKAAVLKRSSRSHSHPLHLHRDANGETLLFRASAEGDVNKVKMLLQLDPSEEHIWVHSKNNDGITPPVAAERNGHSEIQQLFKNLGKPKKENAAPPERPIRSSTDPKDDALLKEKDRNSNSGTKRSITEPSKPSLNVNERLHQDKELKADDSRFQTEAGAKKFSNSIPINALPHKTVNVERFSHPLKPRSVQKLQLAVMKDSSFSKKAEHRAQQHLESSPLEDLRRKVVNDVAQVKEGAKQPLKPSPMEELRHKVAKDDSQEEKGALKRKILPPHRPRISNAFSLNPFKDETVEALMYRLSQSPDARTELSIESKKSNPFRLLSAVLRQSVRNDADPIHLRRDENGETMLFRECAAGDIQKVEMLLELDSSEQHLSYYSMDNNNTTPLKIALEKGHLEIAELLRKVHASNALEHVLRLPNGCEFALLQKALEFSKQKNPQNPIHLLKDENGETMLFQACSVGDIDKVRVLLRVDSSRDHIMQQSKNKDGDTPLSIATAHRHKSVVRELLLRTPNAKGLSRVKHINNSLFHLEKEKGGETMLFQMCSEGDLDGVKALLLLDPGEVHLLDKSRNELGVTPLMAASESGHLQIVEELLKTNPSEEHVMTSRHGGWTALIFACYNGHVDTVKALLRVNSSIEHILCPSCIGWTALMYATCEGHTKVVRVLLDYNSSSRHIETTAMGNTSAIKVAKVQGHRQIEEMMTNALNKFHSVRSTTN